MARPEIGQPDPHRGPNPVTLVEPGIRVALALAKLAEDAWRAGKLKPVDATLSRTVRTDMERLHRAYDLDMPVGNISRVYGLADTIGL